MSEWQETDIGPIPAEWQYVPFQSVLAQPLRNGIYKPKEFHGRGTRVVNMGEIFAFDKLPSIEMSRIELSDDELVKSSVVKGDLLFARRSLVAEGAGKCTLILSQNEPLTFESSIIRARPNSEEADSAYLLYLFSSRTGKYLLKTILRQVAVSGITGTDLAKLKLPLPGIEEQKRVSKVLSCLDRKIENLRKQNETLEKIAQTLFKHWFVDFEFPFDPTTSSGQRFAQGKPSTDGKPFDPTLREEQSSTTSSGQRIAQGSPYKSSGGAMVPSELGEIPAGWQSLTLGDVATNHSETHKFENKAQVIFINTGDVLEGNFLHHKYSSIAILPGQAKKKIRQNDILYSEIRPINRRFAYVNFPDDSDEYVVSTKFMVVRSNERILPRLLYLILKRDSTIQEFHYIADSRSGTFPQITFEAVSKFPIVLPDIKLQKQLMSVIVPLLEKKEFNIQQIQTLTKTRDALLPKLMSGKLRIEN